MVCETKLCNKSLILVHFVTRLKKNEARTTRRKVYCDSPLRIKVKQLYRVTTILLLMGLHQYKMCCRRQGAYYI